GIVQLTGTHQPMNDCREAVTGIPVGQPCKTLNFLHASLFATSNDTRIAQYLVHYADGRIEEVPLRVSENVADWWESPLGPHKLDTNTTLVAWRGTNSVWNSIQLFKFRWSNPRPGTEITFLDFKS